MTRNGKIARLPLAIRQHLNLRPQNGELAQDLSRVRPRRRPGSLLPPKPEPN